MLNFTLLLFLVLWVSVGPAISARPNENGVVYKVNRQDYSYDTGSLRASSPYQSAAAAANPQNAGVYRVSRQDYVGRSDIPFSSPRQHFNVDAARSLAGSGDYWSSQKASPLPRLFVPAAAQQFGVNARRIPSPPPPPPPPSSTTTALPAESDDGVLAAVPDRVDDERPLPPAFTTYSNSKDTSTVRYYSVNDDVEISDEQKELLLASLLAPKRSPQSADRPHIRRRRRAFFPKEYPNQDMPGPSALSMKFWYDDVDSDVDPAATMPPWMLDKLAQETKRDKDGDGASGAKATEKTFTKVTTDSKPVIMEEKVKEKEKEKDVEEKGWEYRTPVDKLWFWMDDSESDESSTPQPQVSSANKKDSDEERVPRQAHYYDVLSVPSFPFFMDAEIPTFFYPFRRLVDDNNMPVNAYSRNPPAIDYYSY